MRVLLSAVTVAMEFMLQAWWHVCLDYFCEEHVHLDRLRLSCILPAAKHEHGLDHVVACCHHEICSRGCCMHGSAISLQCARQSLGIPGRRRRSLDYMAYEAGLGALTLQCFAACLLNGWFCTDLKNSCMLELLDRLKL